MSKIYIVVSSFGEYEDYRESNERAFYNKEDAENYAKELDKIHNYTPEFITEEFEDTLLECDDLIECELFPDYPITEENKDYYNKWTEEQRKKYIKDLCDLMYKKGFFMTEEMYNQYSSWSTNKYYNYHECIVEELELV